jgi:hypothetical protein
MTDEPKHTDLDIAALAASVKAPESLHRRIQEMAEEAEQAHRAERRARRPAAARRTASRRPASGWRLRVAGAVALSSAATAAVLALALSGGGAGPLTVQRAVALTLDRATGPAPSESRAHRSQLDVAVDGLAFPYWRERFGWRSSGARSDKLGGRDVTTVFYNDRAGRRIGYAIVSGPAPSTASAGGTVTWSRGVPYRVSRLAGATVVSWPRAGHLCVIAGRGVEQATLLRLAGADKADKRGPR